VAVSREYRDWVLEQLREAGSVTARAMFGGYGLYLGGSIFGLLAGDTVYFKVDESNRPDYLAAGSRAFQPYEDGTETMPYYEVPIDVLEDPETLAEWAERSASVTRRGASGKKKAKKKK
jgi:DNA transformation protein and related proteins